MIGSARRAGTADRQRETNESADHTEVDVVPKLDERINGLEEKLKQLKTRQARIDARKRALLSRRVRKDDTRRKILAGAIVLAKVEARELDPKLFARWLEAALIRADDRALFELPPRPAP